MRGDPAVVALVAAAGKGDQGAWSELVQRCAPLVWSTCRRYELSRHDAEDIGQTGRLLPAGQLRRLCEPAALPGWPAATTAHECLRGVKAARRLGATGNGSGG